MDRSATHFAARVQAKTRNAIDAYRYERTKGVRWASSAKRYGEEAAREYGDRFLVELIQNAYDVNPRGSTDGKVSVLLDLGEGDHGVLYVANTGRAFSDKNFDAITDIAQSDKPPGEGIGNKGVGFKSVLQVSQLPEVYSARPDSSDGSSFDGYCFRFPTRSDLALLVDVRDLEDILRDVPPHALPMPVEQIPERAIQFRRAGFCTVIRLPLDSERAAQRTEAEMDRLAAAAIPLLLFLDRIELLQLRVHGADGSVGRDDQLRRRTKCIGVRQELEVAEVDLGEQGMFVVASRPVAGVALNAAIAESAPEIDERWATWTQDATVSVAAQLDHTDGEWHFYTFLPMDDSPAPFAAHVNAPFFTKLDRNSVRFSIRFNAFLLNEIAALCVDAAFWMRDNVPAYAPLCLDLICWTNEHLPHLKEAFEKRGTPIGEAELVPIVAVNGATSFSAVSAARRWGPFETSMTTVTAERLCADTGAAIIEPDLGERVDNFSQLRTNLSPFDEGDPSDEELALWLERIAKKLWRRTPVPSGQEWMDFYDDIATVFADRDASPLHGRRLIIDEKNRLQRCGTSDDNSRARTVFFAPVRDQTEGEEEVDAAFDVAPPPELSKVICFTREDLEWHVTHDGSRRTARRCRHFLEQEGLVRRYRTQDVLNAVGRFVRSRRKDAENVAAFEAALHFVYKFKDRVPDTALKGVGLHVPTRSGWRPADESWFAADWPDTKGPPLSRLIQLTAAISPALADVGAHLLRAPDQWLQGAPLRDWTDYLRRLGVRDGLHPIPLTKARFRTHGTAFTPHAWARSADLDEDFAKVWTAHVQNPRPFSDYPMTDCTSVSELWGLPGQFEFEQFSSDAQERYAALVIENLDAWPQESLTVGARRANHPYDSLVKWPTPMQVFLCSATWVPVISGEGSRGCAPAQAWFFDDDKSESAPSFAPLMSWSLRRIARGNLVLRERLRTWCGIRCWNDARDSVGVVRELFSMLDENRAGLQETATIAKEYERALHNSLEHGSDLWSADSTPGIVVHRGDQLEAIKLEPGCGPVYIDTGTDIGTAKLLAELRAPILCALAADGAEVAAKLREVVAAEQIQLMSEVQVLVEVDGMPLTADTAGVSLIAPDRDWLVNLVVAALEFRSGQFRRYSNRSLREAATRLRAAQLVPARELRLSISGHQLSEGVQRREVFAVLHPSRPAIVITGFDGDVRWDTLEQVAHEVAAIVGDSAIGSAIFEAIVRLARTHAVNEEQLAPSQDQCADALGISLRQMQDVTALVQSAVDVLRDRIPVVVACRVAPSAGDELSELLRQLIELLAGATNEDDVAAAIAHFHIEDPAYLIDVAKRVTDLAELRDELRVPYKEFNNALEAVGRPTLANPAAHEQAFDYFVMSHRDAILACLHQVFRPKFDEGAALDGYVALRTFPGLVRDESWLEDYEIPTDSVMQAHVDTWLQRHSAGQLVDHIGATYGVDARRTANRRKVTADGDRAGGLARAWCVKGRHPCPPLWAGDGCGGRLADWADEQGLLDFIELDDLQPLLAHLDRAKLWPNGMPHALDTATLGLTTQDLNRGQSEQELQRALQRQARSTIVLGSRRFSVEPEGFAEIAAAVRETMPATLLQTPFRIDTGPAPSAGRPPRDRIGPKSYYRNVTRYSEGQRQVIGLAAEVIALAWLKAQPRYAAETVVTWRSGYKDKVEGGMEGDDTLGYDIEVRTKSRQFMFEVKGAAEEGTEFELTELEINTARRNRSRDAYRIIYVQHVLYPERTSILLLPNPFSQRGAETYRVVGSGLRYRFEPPD